MSSPSTPPPPPSPSAPIALPTAVGKDGAPAKPSAADIELAFYEHFFFSRGFEPYPVQEEAFSHIFAGHSTLVTVPTGTGKTLMAKAAMYKCLALGQKAIYTTPLRALTEEKYRELCEDFGEDNVGFATGDFKQNRDAPIQVEVAEILWNRIFGDRVNAPADAVIMDEGHYFNDNQRGYVWEQSIIGLDPRTQLVMLSATVGHPRRFCQWVEATRRIPLELVESRERRVPLKHEFREDYLIEVVRDLGAKGDVPAIVFVFGRERCFEVARLLKSCRRFTTDEEKATIEARCADYLLDGGASQELLPLLVHGIGIHHAGILPRYKRLVEELALERLIKFVVCTETIAAGINLPARTVVFPSLRKHVRGQSRIVVPAEFHQMAGRAGRPQFDDEGLAIVLAPEEVVQDIRKEVKNAKKKGYRFDEAKIRKSAYARAHADAQRRGEVLWDAKTHEDLVTGEPAALRSRTQITAEQVLAIGLPDLTQHSLPGSELLVSASENDSAGEAQPDAGKAAEPAAEPAPTTGFGAILAAATQSDEERAAAEAEKAAEAKRAAEAERAALAAAEAEAEAARAAARAAAEADLPAYMRLNIVTVVENLLLSDRAKLQMHKLLAQVTDNLRAVGVIDEHGQQVAGDLIGKLHGMDGLFVYYVLMSEQLDYEDCRALIEYLVDHNVIQKQLDRKEYEKRREWIRERLRERRRDNPLVSWEDVEEEYERQFPRELTAVELVHQRFSAEVPHPQLHGGKKFKDIWARIEDEQLSFLDFVENHHLQHEEGSLFSYLVRVMNFAKNLGEATMMDQFTNIEERVRSCLSVVDMRMI
ncbi:DEAD/DEAH box helicase [Haliangium ochraceum]|uniref:DEAD/DEAH box helicase domain protein n=1 Tax=Haliangium ochraceum (strain DSM 14365 / JCM 11303 / SMP-2) TaxID=502025 RepID=D0LSH4_HALO1|nr:DEAD/DEAH box helicase [Haliangium ochraceum]ACY15673.1 DEAD/DEAH box helicase domain protein [Haliangium ochraceum DSM 14365]